MSRRPTYPFVGLIAGLLFTVGGCRPNPDAVKESARGETVERVRVGRLAHKLVELRTRQPGRMEAYEATPLHSKVVGYVETVLVDLGDTVVKGQPLVRLSIPEMLDEITRKKALLLHADAERLQAEASVKAAESSVLTAKTRVDAAEAGIGRADGEYERWRSEYERIAALAEREAVTRKLADETLNQLRAAEAQRDELVAQIASANAELADSQSLVVKAQADLAAAVARREVAVAELDLTETLASYAEIRAPFDGVITQRQVDTGNFVQPASGDSTPLLVVSRFDRIRLVVDVPEGDAPWVDAGDRATILLPASGNRKLESTVSRTSWSLGSTNRSLRTEVDIDNASGDLRPGMYATVDLLIERREDVAVLPSASIIQEGTDAWVCCVEGGTIRRRPIVLGLRNGAEVEVVSGLSAEDVVVVAQPGALREGQAVETVE